MLEEAMKGVKEINPAAEIKITEMANLKINPCMATCPEGCARGNFECAVKDNM
ncbi:MAG: hypothetical protein OEW71_03110 [Candidatus Bathyarchaeota archaeon]|nr:hypothetical protein [Candidatus Bathyarchaeota archaeon]